ncbi:MAG: chain-length determining protein [Caulobacteraceae bacterium]
MTVHVSPRPKLVDADLQTPPPVAEWKLLLRRIPPLFLAVVVAPILAGAVYYLLIASPMYVSEARFIVRAPTQPQTVGLGCILQGVGIGQTEDQAFAVHEYIMSRDAIQDLQQRHNLRAVLARPGADFLERFPRPLESSSNEELYHAYPRFVKVGHDSTTGVSTLRVSLFRPADAQAVAAALLDGGEALVNRLNDRAAHDAVAESGKQVIEAEAAVGVAQRALTDFRNREHLIDPAKSSAADLELMTKLAGDLATLQAERSGLAATAPQDPQLPGLDSRIKGYERQIDAQNARMAGESGSLAPKISAYEQLVLQRDFAEKLLASATTSLESAREDARRKRLYLERVVNPNLPDAPLLPHRFASIGLIAVSALLAYGMIVLIGAGLKEHRQS